jgi:hypothetical protein
MEYILQDFDVSATVDERNMAYSHYRETRVDTIDIRLISYGKLVIILKH